MMLFASALAIKSFGFIGAISVFITTLIATVSLNQTVIPVLIAVVSSGFIFGLFKIMPERRSILVQASENAVRVVNDAIGTLQKELSESRVEIIKLEAELSMAKESRHALEGEVAALQAKVTRLETSLEIYQQIQTRERIQGTIPVTITPVGPNT